MVEKSGNKYNVYYKITKFITMMRIKGERQVHMKMFNASLRLAL